MKDERFLVRCLGSYYFLFSLIFFLLLLLFDVTFEQKIHNLSSLSLQPTRSLFPNGFRVESKRKKTTNASRMHLSVNNDQEAEREKEREKETDQRELVLRV